MLAAEYPFVRVCDFGHWGDGGVHLNLVWSGAEAPRPAAEVKAESAASSRRRSTLGGCSAPPGSGEGRWPSRNPDARRYVENEAVVC